MNRKGKKKSLFLFFIKMLIIFVILDAIMMGITGVFVESTFFYKYGEDLMGEIFYAFCILIVMLLFRNAYVFSDKKESFWSSITLSIPMLLISFVIFGTNVINAGHFPLDKLINMILLCIFVGIAEEFLCRGWLQNEFIERFSNGKKETILSIILASFIFGIMHITNIIVQTPFETIMQILNAVALGFLLGSIYFKTKNIWAVIFLHSFYDFAIYIGEINLIKDCTYNTPTNDVIAIESISLLIISLIWIFNGMYVLKKCKFDYYDFKKSDSNVIKIIICVLLLTLLIPYDKLSPNYENYKVCYEYNEIDAFDEYIIHNPKINEFSIGYTNENESELDKLLSTDEFSYELVLNDNNTASIKNNITSYTYILDLDSVQDILVLENDDSYSLYILTYENESTIYYTDYFKKGSMSNEDEYLNNITFEKYELPRIVSLDYISVEDKEYALLISYDNDSFIIMDNELYIIKN